MSAVQDRLEAALARVARGTPAAMGMTVAEGPLDEGVARLRGCHITLRSGWAATQTDAALDFVLRHEACHHAVELRAVATPVTTH